MAICRTPDCGNECIEIELVDPTPFVICGPCGLQITDISPPIPEPPPEEPEEEVLDPSL